MTLLEVPDSDDTSSNLHKLLRGITNNQLKQPTLTLANQVSLNSTKEKNMRVISVKDAAISIESLVTLLPIDIGNSKWRHVHSALENLSLQTTLLCQDNENNFIIDLFLQQKKIACIIQILLSVEIWRERISRLPLGSLDLNCLLFSLGLRTELLILSILEACLYTDDVIESEQLDSIYVDLIDYCHRGLVFLNTLSQDQINLILCNKLSHLEGGYAGDIIQSHNYQCAVICISMLRLVSDNVHRIPLSVLSRLFSPTDTVSLLVPLLTGSRPWIAYDTNFKVWHFTDGQWIHMESSTQTFSKTEAQLWLCMYNVLMDTQCRQRRVQSPYRRSCIGRLEPLLSSVTIRQWLPPLEQLWPIVMQVSDITLADIYPMSATNIHQPHTKPILTCLVIEEVALVRDCLLHDSRMTDDSWHICSQRFLNNVSSMDLDNNEDRQCHMPTYNDSYIEALMDPPICENQSCPFRHSEIEIAIVPCSKCNNAWYCSQSGMGDDDCALEDRASHESICHMLCKVYH